MMAKDFLISLVVWGMALIFLGGVSVSVATHVEVDQQFYLSGGFGLTAVGAGVLAIVYGTLLRMLQEQKPSVNLRTEENHGRL